MLLGTSRADGLAFATVVHGSQTLDILLFGAGALLVLGSRRVAAATRVE